MADTFSISPAVIKWLKETLDISELPQKQQDQLFKWGSGEKQPTFSELEEFSKKARVPLGYLFLSNAPKEKIELIEFRTVDSRDFQTPSRNFVDTYYEMKAVQSWMIDYLEEMEIQPPNFPGRFKSRAEARPIVKYIRELLNLDPELPVMAARSMTFNQLRKKISDLGVLVMQSGVVRGNTHRKLDLDEFRGFALFDKRAPLIFINACDSQAGRTFTLLHEFVHILIGSDDLYNSSEGSGKREERLANAVTAELLVPSTLFKEEWRTNFHNNPETCIQNLAKTFGNSETVIARRALDFGLINEQTYKLISRGVTERFKQNRSEKKSGGNYYNTMGTRLDPNFLISLGQSVEMGATTYTEAFRLTNTSNKTFKAVIEKAGYGGAA